MTHKKSHRADRAADVIQKSIARIIAHEMKDARLKMLTVVDVEVSSDLSSAKIYVSSLSESPHSEILAVLNRAKSFIRRELTKFIELRLVPELTFIYDDSSEKGMRISQLIHQVCKENDDGDSKSS